MRKSFCYFSCIFVFVVFAGCSAGTSHKLTPLEIRSMQTRAYEEDRDLVFRSVISVFQDLGYTIQNADLQSGLISAESSAKSNPWASAFTGLNRIEQTRATAFVEKIGKQAHVRLNFVESTETSSSYGQRNRNDNPVLDINIYQNAFERIEEAIFIRSAN